MIIDTKPLTDFLKDIRNTLGFIMLIISFVSLCPNIKNIIADNAINIIYWTLMLAFCWATIIAIFKRNRKKISKKIRFPETTIEIKYGDIFNEKGHLVIGINDCFDTELGEVISPNSIQGQFEDGFYKDNIQKLDQEITEQLKSKNIQPEIKHTKLLGKKEYYPLGTTIALGNISKRYFLCAYSKMDDNCKAESNFTWINFSLLGLWDEVRKKGQCMDIVMPLIGSGLSRVNEDRIILLASIIMSFISCSKNQPIARKLTIVLRKEDKKYYNFQQIENVLNNLIEG